MGERLAGDREREGRMRANRVVSAVGDRESEERGVEGPEQVVLVVEWNSDWTVEDEPEDEPEDDLAGSPGLASGLVGVVFDMADLMLTRTQCMSCWLCMCVDGGHGPRLSINQDITDRRR